MTPGGASQTGLMTALDALGGIHTAFSNIMNDEPVKPKNVSQILALTSFAGFPSVIGRLMYSMSQQEQAGLESQARAASSQGRSFPYIPLREMYKPDTTLPVSNPIGEYKNSPVLARPEMFPYPSQQTQPREPSRPQPTQPTPQRVAPQRETQAGESLLVNEIQETPVSLFDQR